MLATQTAQIAVTSPLQAALTIEAIRRQDDRNKQSSCRAKVAEIVSSIHEAFCRDKELLASLMLTSDFGSSISLADAQPKPFGGHIQDEGVDLCPTDKGITIRLGARLHPIDLRLLVHAATEDDPGSITLSYVRCPPLPSSIEATFALDTPAEELLSELYKRLTKHVHTV